MWSEYRGNPILANLGIYGPNMEGKEVRFGAGLSALFTKLLRRHLQRVLLITCMIA